MPVRTGGLAVPLVRTGVEVGLDIGGTFTDVVVRTENETVIGKVLTTPADHSTAFVEGTLATLAVANSSLAQVARIAHGTTLATNAVLTRTGARTALVTTRGFRDVLEIRRLRVPVLFDLTWQKPSPLVPRRWRFEVDERTRADGTVVRDLDLGPLMRQMEVEVEAHGLESVAICLLHSYARPEGERVVARAIRERWPQLAVSASSDLLPLPGEYERTSTVVVNAYLLPLVRTYLSKVAVRLRDEGLAGSFEVMQSDGTLTTVTSVADEPARIVESGPAAGAIAARVECERLGIANAIALDIGGTTAKATLIENGSIARTYDYEVGGDLSRRSRLLNGGGYALALPALDIAEISAGGGSIVSVGLGGTIEVGPTSAGARPGPACYGLGGTLPTITDAHVVVGHLADGQLLGGTLPVSAERARRAFADIARRLDRDAASCAGGALEVADATMLRALRAVSVERGRDPRGLVLVAYGGAGGLHAARLAGALGCRTAIVPRGAGVFSGRGLLDALLAREEVVSVRLPFARLGGRDVTDALARGEERIRGWMTEHLPQQRDFALEREARVRQVGQWTALSLPLETTDDLDRLSERFREHHERTYAHRGGDLPLELVEVRVRAVRPAASAARWMPVAERRAVDRPLERDIHVFRGRPPVRARVIPAGSPERGPLPGPLVIESYDTTTVVPPNARWRRDESGNDRIEL